MEKKEKNMGGAMERFAAEKKKTVMATCLIVLMLFMWVRVLTRSGPEKASAALSESSGQVESVIEISYVDLPNISGRNDIIGRDFFKIDNWNDFSGGRFDVESYEVVTDDSQDDQMITDYIAKALELEAVVMGDRPQAFINGMLVSAGDRIEIDQDANELIIEVTKIKGDQVVLEYDDLEIKLKVENTPDDD